MILLKSYMPADQSMGSVLLCAHILSKIGKREDDEMSIEELKKLTGKSEKTVRNTLTQMTKDGTVERTGRGSYRITNLGIMRVKEMLESGPEEG
jgi:predicted transcriptional regulator of viral defense system